MDRIILPDGGKQNMLHVEETAVNTTHCPDDEAASTSETPINFCQTTWHIIPEDSHLQKYKILIC
jgi:hypothetical protein